MTVDRGRLVPPERDPDPPVELLAPPYGVVTVTDRRPGYRAGVVALPDELERPDPRVSEWLVDLRHGYIHVLVTKGPVWSGQLAAIVAALTSGGSDGVVG